MRILTQDNRLVSFDEDFMIKIRPIEEYNYNSIELHRFEKGTNEYDSLILGTYCTFSNCINILRDIMRSKDYYEMPEMECD